MDSNPGKRSTGGGAATQAGLNFQNRVAAWVAVHILCEQDCQPIWKLSGVPTFVRCETEEPVDDILVGTSTDGFGFLQVKHSLSLSNKTNSPLANVINQFVRQFLANRLAKPDARPWQRPLDPDQDRLVLVTSAGSSLAIRKHIPAVLSRLLRLVPGQTIEDAAQNRPEANVMRALLNHSRLAWRSAIGADPEDADLRALLSLWSTEVLDVDAGGHSEIEAINLLRQILRDPKRAEAAWTFLVETCAQFGRTHSGSDRPGFQKLLSDAGFILNTVRSYREDVQTLKEYTARTIIALEDLTRIRAGAIDVKIRRASTDVLIQAAERGSLLVVGEPGAGKSGALHDLASALKERGRDVVFLAVDRLAFAHVTGLAPALPWRHELPEVLRNWTGCEPGFLVIDALDAARGELEAAEIREAISSVMKDPGRWRVIASIRKFDLRYSERIKQLFITTSPVEAPPSLRDTEFRLLRHINVPHLAPHELAEIGRQAPTLGHVIGNAPPELLQLLEVPFNLRLVAELIAEGMALQDFIPITTQLQLLDRYWRHRVIGGDRRGDVRESILRRACQEMAAKRVLRAEKAIIADGGDGSAIHEILSAHVLVEWQPSPLVIPDRYVLVFAHHLLFDYAAARLLLRGAPETPVQRLEEDPELSLVIRPSIAMHFHHLWALEQGHWEYWRLVLRIIQSPKLPQIAKLIGPTAAATSARNLDDVGTLLSWLSSQEQGERTGAEHILQHLTGALLAALPDTKLLMGADAGPWCDVLEHVSRSFRPSTAYSARSLIAAMCETPEKLTNAQLAAVGSAARRLLEFAWQQASRDPWLVTHALWAVCKTFRSDRNASAILIYEALKPEHLQVHGPEELPWIAREVAQLAGVDPALAHDIYIATFQLNEPSDAAMPLGPPSRIFSLTTNRRQEIQGARYQLASAYPTFLWLAPIQAAVTAVEVYQAHVAREHPSGLKEGTDLTFQFGEHTAHIRRDYSSIWDSEFADQHYEACQILVALLAHLESLAVSDKQLGAVDDLLNVIVTHANVAGIWRRLLRLGARAPDTLGIRLLPLLSARPILTEIDTSYVAGELLKVIFTRLSTAQREVIEETILAIPASFEEHGKEWGDQAFRRLLACLPMEALVTESAKSELLRMQQSGGVPGNEPPFQIGPMQIGQVTEDQILRARGVAVESEPNQHIRDLEAPVVDFASKYRNSTPSASEVLAIHPQLRALHDALCSASQQGAHQEQVEYAWGNLAEACQVAARTEHLDCSDTPGEFLRTCLLQASERESPLPDPNIDAQFDECISWGGPAARISAAQGLVLLARHPNCATDEVVHAIDRLSCDPVPPVRFQIATSLTCLYKTAPVLMWRLVSQFVTEESSRGVLSGISINTLPRLGGAHPDKVATLAVTIFQRFMNDAKAKGLLASCVNIFAGLYVWQNHGVCRRAVLELVDRPLANADLIQTILFNLRQPLTHGAARSPQSHADEIRYRALDLVDRAVTAVRRALSEIEDRNKEAGLTVWPESDQAAAKELAILLDHIAKEVYFASGAFDRKKSPQQPIQSALGTDERARFYLEAGEILDHLADVGLPSVAHSVLETLESFIEIDPAGVFLRINRLVGTARRAGYQYESLAVDRVVRIVQRYLAEYRTLLQERPECRQALVAILDVFVEAGWPSARRLTYRLEEIFR